MTQRASRKRLALLAILPLAALGWVGLDVACHPRLTGGPMVQQLTPSGFVLSWRLERQAETSLQVFGPDGSSAGLVTVDQKGKAAVAGLSPGTQYAYKLRAQGWPREVVLRRAALRTAPAAGQPIRFIAFGDTGDGGRDQARVASRLLEHAPDLVVHTGDVVYDRGELGDYPAKFYQPYAELLASVPVYPVLGNHDVRNSEMAEFMGRPYLDAFVLPENGPVGNTPEREYWFDFGNTRFIGLDTNLHEAELAAAVAPWLDAVLASAGPLWKIVFFHEPPYTHGGHEPADKVVATLVPVLDRHRVHLVLNGHNHMFERTHPLRGGQPVADGEGTVYIVTGAGGAGLYEEVLPAPSYLAAWYHDRHSFTVIDVGDDQMRIRQVNDLGQMVDTAVIPKAPARPAT